MALSIPHVGEELAELLATHFKTLQRLAATENKKLEMITGIGPIVAQAVHDWFRQPENQRMLERLLKHVMIKRMEKLVTIRLTAVADRTFVLTGSLPSLTREAAKQLIKQAGGKVVSAVSARVDYLVAGADPGSKYNKAEQLGVKIISEDAFQRLLKQ